MVTYEYQCDNCELNIEYVQPINNCPDINCPECGSHMTKQLFVSNFMVRNIKTIAQQAEANSRKNGRAWTEDKEREALDRWKKKKQNTQQ